MSENMKKFTEALSSNEELRNKFAALSGEEDSTGKIIVFANEHGFTLAEDDLAANVSAAELSDNELENAAGGAGGWLNCPKCERKFLSAFQFVYHLLNDHK